MAVKIVIEPIFEADFQDNSYGFRPKRSAHQAVDDVKNHHDKLMQLVAKRIVDKQILKLIKMWLKAPIVEECWDGKKEYKGNDPGLNWRKLLEEDNRKAVFGKIPPCGI